MSTPIVPVEYQEPSVGVDLVKLDVPFVVHVERAREFRIQTSV